MLGRLQMTAEECRQAYLALSERVFQLKKSGLLTRGKDLWKARGRFDSKELEEAIKEVVENSGFADNLESFMKQDLKCKV
jgi:hypothetical protein